MSKIFISTSNNKQITCDYIGQKTQELVLFIHGIPSTSEETPLLEAVEYFSKKRFAVARLSLYDYRKHARQLMDCSLTTISTDIDNAVAFFSRKGHSRIHVVGHSIGGLAILLTTKQRFISATLWDPSYKLSLLHGPAAPQPPIHIKQANVYILQTGVNYAVSETLIHELENINWESLGKSMNVPFAVFTAGNGVLNASKHYARNASVKTSIATISKASHSFEEPGPRKQLFTITEKWIRLHDK